VPHVTEELVRQAYGALGSGNMDEIKKYWADNMVWQVPGQNRLSGWYHSRDEFLAFMGQVGELSGGSFKMDTITILLNEEYSADITRNRGNRAEHADKLLDIEVVHVLRWRDGKVIAGRGAIFGNGSNEYDHFWSRAPAKDAR
jgi:uncharacterized protein